MVQIDGDDVYIVDEQVDETVGSDHERNGLRNGIDILDSLSTMPSFEIAIDYPRVLRFEDLQEMRISSIVDLKDSMRAVTRWYLQDNSILRRFPTR